MNKIFTTLVLLGFMSSIVANSTDENVNIVIINETNDSFYAFDKPTTMNLDIDPHSEIHITTLPDGVFTIRAYAGHRPYTIFSNNLCESEKLRIIEFDNHHYKVESDRSLCLER